MPPCPHPSDPDFKQKFKVYALHEIAVRNEEMSKKSSSATGTSGVSTADTIMVSTSTPDDNSSNGDSEAPIFTPTTTTDENLSDMERLEKRLCQKIDDAFAFLDERLDKEFQLLHHIMIASWENTK